MVGMDCQGQQGGMVKMESQGRKERRETLDHRACKVQQVCKVNKVRQERAEWSTLAGGGPLARV